MKVPVQIPIGGYKIRVDYVNELAEGNSGEAYPLHRRIAISKSAARSAEDLRATLLHEVCHIALGLTGHSEFLGDKREEAIVYGLEAMLAPILVFNPKAQIKYREVSFAFED